MLVLFAIRIKKAIYFCEWENENRDSENYYFTTTS